MRYCFAQSVVLVSKAVVCSGDGEMDEVASLHSNLGQDGGPYISTGSLDNMLNPAQPTINSQDEVLIGNFGTTCRSQCCPLLFFRVCFRGSSSEVDEAQE